MTRPRVFVTRHLPGGALDYLRDHSEVDVWQGELPPTPQDLRQHTARAHSLLTLLTDRVDSELLSSAPGLLVVSNMATGFDNIDVKAANEHAVLVTRTPGVLTETTADFAFALLLAAARRVVEGDRYAREGLWKTWGPEVLLGQDVHGSALGIVGLGRIGAEVARRGRGFGMRILYTSRSRKPGLEAELGVEYRGLTELLGQSDFVSLHTALSLETRHLINARTLRLMKPTAILVNTGRGPLVDQAALYEALRDGVITGAALDVTDPEPMLADDPLLALPNVIVTPHIASASVATRSRMAMLAAENLVQALSGQVPDAAVNPEVTDVWRARLAEVLSG